MLSSLFVDNAEIFKILYPGQRKTFKQAHRVSCCWPEKWFKLQAPQLAVAGTLLL
jgi:hypothetical protein